MKIINDPLHGFLRLQSKRALQAVDHPFVQRLRRISQLGLAQMVYPNATHTRFAHALGVMHLMDEALQTLTLKQLIHLSEETYEAALLAALLHDIGHGPFSHSLEGRILAASHEAVGQALIALLERELGDLSETKAILSGTHPQLYLCQLLQGPLDVDRLDYLVRDSFFTGVQEGIVGTERLIYTLAVTSDGRLAVEEKGLASAEKLLLARRFMYWQVYLHKAVIGAERLLQQWWDLAQRHEVFPELCPPESEAVLTPENLAFFMGLDEMRLWSFIQRGTAIPLRPLQVLSQALLHRRLYKVTWGFPETTLQSHWESHLPAALRPYAAYFWIEGEAHSTPYEPEPATEVQILSKQGTLHPLSELAPWLTSAGPVEKPYWGFLSAASLEWLLQWT